MDNLQLLDIFDIADVQNLQILFSNATSVASIITTPNGVPITTATKINDIYYILTHRPDKDFAQCLIFDAKFSDIKSTDLGIYTCPVCGLWYSGVRINVGGNHLANWLIGQVRNEADDEKSMLKYADQLNIEPNEFTKALREIPIMSQDKFESITNMLHAYVNEISEKAYSNFLLKQAIKDHKVKEEELVREKTLLQALMDTMPDHIYFKDRESRFIRSNPSQTKNFNLSRPEEIIGKTDFDFFSNEHASAAFNDEQNIIENGITLAKVEKETWPDRPDTWASTIKAPLRDFNGSIIGTLGISRNITIQKKAEEELKQSEEQFRTIIENMGEGLGIVSPTEDFLFTNPMADEIFGLPKGKLVGRNLKEFMSEDTFAGVLYQTSIRKEGQKSIYENEIIRPNGEKRLLLVTSVPKFDRDGIFLGSYSVFRDITVRKEQELIIQNQNKELKEINSQKDKLFSIIAHDLRSPFNSFLGLTELMEKELPQMTNAEIQEISVNLRKSATRIYNLLSNLLEWSRIQRGMITLTAQNFLLNDVVQQCTEALLEMSVEKGIDVINEIPHDFEITADPNMLQITIHNLLTNALKFTFPEGKIFIRTHRKNKNEVEIEVEDTGIGMSYEMVENLFRVDNNYNRTGTQGEQSTGLGLLLCKEFIEKHNGHIQVYSKEGSGSKFVVTLPLNI